MKTELTLEQSRTLVGRGVHSEKASKVAWQITTDSHGKPFTKELMKQSWHHGISHKGGIQRVGLTHIDEKPIFTLTDLLEILPKEIRINNKDCFLNIPFNNKVALATYMGSDDKNCLKFEHCELGNEELIDNLYNLMLWVIDNGYLKLEEK